MLDRFPENHERNLIRRESVLAPWRPRGRESGQRPDDSTDSVQNHSSWPVHPVCAVLFEQFGQWATISAMAAITWLACTDEVLVIDDLAMVCLRIRPGHFRIFSKSLHAISKTATGN